jgi:hypothetical protein
MTVMVKVPPGVGVVGAADLPHEAAELKAIITPAAPRALRVIASLLAPRCCCPGREQD